MTTMYTPGQYRKLKAERDALAESVKRTQVRLDVFSLKYRVPEKDYDWLRQHLDEALPRSEART